MLRLQFFERELLSGFERWQLMFEFFVFFVLAFLGFFIDSEKTIELQDRTGDAEPEDVGAALCIDVDRGLIEDRWINLRCNKALPDQLVDLELIFF